MAGGANVTTRHRSVVTYQELRVANIYIENKNKWRPQSKYHSATVLTATVLKLLARSSKEEKIVI